VHGTTGNISVRTDAGFLLTPTGSALDRLDPQTLSEMSTDGEHRGGDPPTKEFGLHLALYAGRPNANAVVHTHSTHCVAVSTIAGIDRDDMLPVLTPYYVMRVGRCAVTPYRTPGSAQLAVDVAGRAEHYHAIVLAHHGPVIAGATLNEAVDTLEELEEAARLFLLLRGHNPIPLDPVSISELRTRFPAPAP
jgi:ribulose-5-phosphate 4-epimerase/fuculose-1-phosphate aldolase